MASTGTTRVGEADSADRDPTTEFEARLKRGTDGRQRHLRQRVPGCGISGSCALAIPIPGPTASATAIPTVTSVFRHTLRISFSFWLGTDQ